jgi:hypothetical protein
MNYRKIYEQFYGGKIVKGYHIHHKDMNHANNDPLNLEALAPDEHAQKHGFLNNFIMAGSTSQDRHAAAMRKPEVRAKLSAAHTGKIRTKEHRANISAGNRTWVRSEETKSKMSEAHRGKKLAPFSKEHRENISKAARNRWKS